MPGTFASPRCKGSGNSHKNRTNREQRKAEKATPPIPGENRSETKGDNPEQDAGLPHVYAVVVLLVVKNEEGPQRRHAGQPLPCGTDFFKYGRQYYSKRRLSTAAIGLGPYTAHHNLRSACYPVISFTEVNTCTPHTTPPPTHRETSEPLWRR